MLTQSQPVAQAAALHVLAKNCAMADQPNGQDTTSRRSNCRNTLANIASKLLEASAVILLLVSLQDRTAHLLDQLQSKETLILPLWLARLASLMGLQTARSCVYGSGDKAGVGMYVLRLYAVLPRAVLKSGCSPQ